MVRSPNSSARPRSRLHSKAAGLAAVGDKLTYFESGGAATAGFVWASIRIRNVLSQNSMSEGQ